MRGPCPRLRTAELVEEAGGVPAGHGRRDREERELLGLGEALAQHAARSPFGAQLRQGACARTMKAAWKAVPYRESAPLFAYVRRKGACHFVNLICSVLMR
jgi:hypothetical protein